MVRREVVRLTRREPVCRDFKFVSQIRDAARGGTRNIAEGWSRFGPAEIVRYLTIAKSSLDETEDELLDGLESGYWSRQEYNVVRSYLRRTHGAIRGWWRYLESPQAHRVYEGHKTRIKREIELGLRRPAKDPTSRPWRRREKPERVRPAAADRAERPEPRTEPEEPGEPGEPEEPGEPGEPEEPEEPKEPPDPPRRPPKLI